MVAPNALIGRSAAAEHRETGRGSADGDHILRVALGVGHIELDVVAGTRRDVLDLQGCHHRTAPLGLGVAADFRQGSRRSRGGGQIVVRAVDFVGSSRDLEQTPGLIDTNVADNVRCVNAGISP